MRTELRQIIQGILGYPHYDSMSREIDVLPEPIDEVCDGIIDEVVKKAGDALMQQLLDEGTAPELAYVDFEEYLEKFIKDMPEE
jgi:hypothetical protein